MVRPIPVQLRQEQLQRPLTLYFNDTYTHAIRSEASNVDLGFKQTDKKKPSNSLDSKSGSHNSLDTKKDGATPKKSKIRLFNFMTSSLSKSRNKLQTFQEEGV
uniref:Uncharacterized protein n=1 Tax=Clytia hemisphaerica TaxID=252671 RepID=A0A7M5XCA0_9CNID|eukprot:TCONS_00050229-protein